MIEPLDLILVCALPGLSLPPDVLMSLLGINAASSFKPSTTGDIDDV
jgi:hypothetical protein